MAEVNLSDAINSLTIEPLEAPDDAVVTGAIIILEVTHMDDSGKPYIYWTSNEEMSSQTEVGCVMQVLDRLRDTARRGWVDE